MDATLSGRLFTPYTRLLDTLFSRVVVTGPKDLPDPPGGLLSPPQGDPGQSIPATADSAKLGVAAASPVRVLNQEVLRALDKALSVDGGKGLDRSAEPDAYTPEKVADRILGFIGQLVGQETDTGRRSELLKQVRAGVEKGFAEARDILDGLGVLKGDIAANVDRTYALIQDGLDKLATNESGVTPDNTAAEVAPTGTVTTQAGFVAASYTSRQSTSLVINTRDGDRVTIDITKQATSSHTEVAGSAGNAGFSSVQNSRQASVNFTFSVEGELDKDEKKAIDQLVRRIDKVSGKFFDGNVQAAFNKAASLKFDGEELAAYSLKLDSSQTYRAVAAYQQSQQTAAKQPDTAAATASLGDAAALGGEVRGLIDTAAATTPLASPANAVADIFTTLTNDRASAFGLDALKKDALSTLRDLVSRIVDSYRADRSDEADEESEQNDGQREEATERAA